MPGDSDVPDPVTVIRIQAGVVGAVAIVDHGGQGADTLGHLGTALGIAFVELVHLLHRSQVVHLDRVQVGAFRNRTLSISKHHGQGTFQVIDRRWSRYCGIQAVAANRLGGDIQAFAQRTIVGSIGRSNVEPAKRLAVVRLARPVSIGGIEIVDAELGRRAR